MDRVKKKRLMLPNKPGVYIYKDKNKNVIYIGKALSLKKRVASYFYKGVKDRKTLQLVSQIDDLDYIVVMSEFEALLLEAKLIKQYQPKFNIDLKDNKRYLYIAISKEKFPRVFIVRRPEIEEGLLDWYGPFPSARDTREVLKIIRNIFPFRSCKTLPSSPCLYSHIHLCPAPCVNNSNEYKKTITKIRKLLSGQTNKIIKELKKEMILNSQKENFEKAQEIKLQIIALENITQGWKNIPEGLLSIEKIHSRLKKFIIRYSTIDPITITKIEGYDVSNLGKKIIVGSMIAFTKGIPDKSNYRKFKINYDFNLKNKRKNLENQSDTDAMYQIVRRRLNHPEWIYPQLILLDGGKGQISSAFKALKEKNLHDQIPILGLSKKRETIIIPQIENGEIKKWKSVNLSKNSQILKLLQRIRDESHRFAQNYYKTLHKKSTLGI